MNRELFRRDPKRRNMKYFSGTIEIDARNVSTYDARFAEDYGIPADVFAQGKRVDSFSRWLGKVGDQWLPVTRIINYKTNPSKHKCDGRCLHAKGRNCECECGGANHGAGA